MHGTAVNRRAMGNVALGFVLTGANKHVFTLLVILQTLIILSKDQYLTARTIGQYCGFGNVVASQ